MSPRGWARVALAWRRFEAFHEELFASRWRHELRREARGQEDTLRALVLLDSLGVENPVAYETLDVVPHLLADVHGWHQRMGREDYGAPGMCC